MKLCVHEPHRTLTHIKDPKWTTDEILIAVDDIKPSIEHYLIQFSNDKAIKNFSSVSAKEKYGWFYMSGKMIRRHKVRPNGGKEMYIVPMSKREVFEKVNPCEHMD